MNSNCMKKKTQCKKTSSKATISKMFKIKAYAKNREMEHWKKKEREEKYSIHKNHISWEKENEGSKNGSWCLLIKKKIH